MMQMINWIPFLSGWLPSAQTLVQQTAEMRFLAYTSVTLLGIAGILCSIIGTMVWKRLDHLHACIHEVKEDVKDQLATIAAQQEERQERLFTLLNDNNNSVQSALLLAGIDMPEGAERRRRPTRKENRG